MRIFLAILLFLACLFPSLSSGQNRSLDNLEIEVTHGLGFVLPEYQFVNLITEDFTYNYELSIRKNTYGKDGWQELYHYPSYGLRFIHSTLGNDEVLGKLWGVYPYFQFVVLNFNRFKIYNQFGLGYSRVNRKYDLEDNYLNVAVGSYGNIHFNTRFIANYQLFDRLNLNTSISFDHFSNGNTAEPNLGINYVSWMSGLSYAIGQQSEKKMPGIPEKDGYLEQEIVLSIGGKHSRALASTFYRTHSFSYEVRKQTFRALHLGLGADIFYDSSVKDQLEKDGKDFQPINRFQSGIHFSQTIVYNRFSLTFQEGIYLGLTEKVNNYFMYNRGIAKYKLTDKLTFRFVMKSHLYILDYPEFGLGLIL
ncbi:MAG: acyloxyacyl hydrolase [Vicingaceae bacterium]